MPIVEPSGAPGGGSQSNFYASVGVAANSPNTDGGYASRPLDATEDGQVVTAVNVLQTVAAGLANGFNSFINAPDFTGGTCTLFAAQITVVNAAGTVKLALNSPDGGFALTTGETFAPDFRTWTEIERISADLTVNATDGSTIDSTAGGQFMAQMWCELMTVGLT